MEKSDNFLLWRKLYMTLLDLGWDWKMMARVQDILGIIDGPKSCRVHNWLGRFVGSIKKPYDPMPSMIRSVELLKKIKKHGGTPAGKMFFEVGTGWAPNMPLAYWLAGAEKTITVDLNTYMQPKYVQESLDLINKKKTDIETLFGTFLDKKRFDSLLQFSKTGKFRINDFLELCRIDYIAPGDAAQTNLPDCCIDYHVSCGVYEHIPPEILRNILTEGNRIIKKDGIFIDQLGLTDHFANFSKAVSKVNFLQYSDDEWKKYNNNKYVYVNRLRYDDFFALFNDVQHEIIDAEPDIHQDIKEMLDRGEMKIDKRFQGKSTGILSTMTAWFVTRYTEKPGEQ
jgi:SAM-dependent methyltransferase